MKKIRMKGQNLRGFTLIESLLVLLIVLLLASYPLISWQRWQEQLEVSSFFKLFEKHLVYTQQTAIEFRRESRVSVRRGEQLIYFKHATTATLKEVVPLNIPSRIQVVAHTDLRFLPASGNASKMAVFRFQVTGEEQEIKYQYYLGSGRFVKKIGG